MGMAAQTSNCCDLLRLVHLGFTVPLIHTFSLGFLALTVNEVLSMAVSGSRSACCCGLAVDV